MQADQRIAVLIHRHRAVRKVLHGQLSAWGYEVVEQHDASASPTLGLVEASASEAMRSLAHSFPNLPLLGIASVRRPFDVFDAMRHGAWNCVVLQDIHAVRDAVGANRPGPGDVDPLRRTIDRLLASQREPASTPLVTGASNVQDHLASMRALSKGAGDRINNPLTIVKAALENARDVLEELEPNARDTERIEELKAALRDCGPAVERMLAVSQGLRSFALPGNAVLGNVDVARIIREIAPTCEIVCPPATRVFANEAGVREAFTAIVANAVESYSAEADDKPINVTVTVVKPNVEVEVRDRGVGMSETVLGRAFEPFFTHGKGLGALGLGLTLARERIRVMGGEIRLASVVDGGTTVQVRLPCGV